MANSGGDRGMITNKSCLVFGVAFLLTIFNGIECTFPSGETVFDVMKFGAKANGIAFDNTAIIKAWHAACDCKGPARVLIPHGEYKAGEIVFAGPCTAAKPITVEIQGNLLADTDPSTYTQGAWIMIENVDGLTITGGGTINGHGQGSWKHATSTSPSPVSMRLLNVKNTKMNNLNFVDSMGFHVRVENSVDVYLSNLKITAPLDSPFTDGVHISHSSGVTVADSVIGTGNDCVSVHDSSKKILISGVSCSPGHGISVWSQGKLEDPTNLKEVTIKNCKLVGTTIGAIIKNVPML